MHFAFHCRGARCRRLRLTLAGLASAAAAWAWALPGLPPEAPPAPPPLPPDFFLLGMPQGWRALARKALCRLWPEAAWSGDCRGDCS